VEACTARPAREHAVCAGSRRERDRRPVVVVLVTIEVAGDTTAIDARDGALRVAEPLAGDAEMVAVELEVHGRRLGHALRDEVARAAREAGTRVAPRGDLAAQDGCRREIGSRPGVDRADAVRAAEDAGSGHTALVRRV